MLSLFVWWELPRNSSVFNVNAPCATTISVMFGISQAKYCKMLSDPADTELFKLFPRHFIWLRSSFCKLKPSLYLFHLCHPILQWLIAFVKRLIVVIFVRLNEALYTLCVLLLVLCQRKLLEYNRNFKRSLSFDRYSQIYFYNDPRSYMVKQCLKHEINQSRLSYYPKG